MALAVRTEHLTKYYGAVVGLDDVSLEVSEGEVFGFLGPNGAGKTTTIRLLLDLVRPTRGAAWIGGFNCQSQGLDARRLVGYLPGELPIYPEVTGERYLRFLADIARRPVAASRLEALLHRFDVSDIDLRRRMRDYSHGMRRKLGIIQALAGDPRVLMLDEPTSGLDPLMIDAFAETLHELKQDGRTTVFLSSHVLSEVEKTCDRVGLVRRGRLVAMQLLAEIRAARPRRVTVLFAMSVKGPPPALDSVTMVSRSPRAWVLDVRGPLGPLVTGLGELPVDDMHVEPFALEDYVLRFYTGDEA